VGIENSHVTVVFGRREPFYYSGLKIVLRIVKSWSYGQFAEHFKNRFSCTNTHFQVSQWCNLDFQPCSFFFSSPPSTSQIEYRMSGYLVIHIIRLSMAGFHACCHAMVDDLKSHYSSSDLRDNCANYLVTISA
jgi:hypothetical protein